MLLSATTLIAINIWTGAPLAALWVGSRVVGARLLSMTAVFVVIVTLAVLVSAMTFALIRLGARYDRLVGRPAGKPTLCRGCAVCAQRTRTCFAANAETPLWR